MNNFELLCNKYGTDKYNYADIYDHFFRKYMSKKVIIFEIGIFDGASLKVYNEYFNNNCEIYAIDIKDKSEYNDTNIHIYQCDQNDINKLKNILDNIGPIDIFIDDGSHIWDHQINCLINLYNYISEDGIYIIEDIGTSILHNDTYNNWHDESESPLKFIVYKKILSYLNSDLQYEFFDNVKSYEIFCKYLGYSMTVVFKFK